MVTLNINTDALVVHTNRLEKVRKQALPFAIRGALNNAAFDLKQNTMPRSARAEFTQRSPNFFRANSRVDMAKGNDIRDMEATVGFLPQGLKGKTNQAIEDLQQQEHGGKIKGRGFIPKKEARGGSNARMVKPTQRLSAINKIHNSNNVRGMNRAEKFVKTALRAGRGDYVIGNYQKKYLYRIDSISRKKVNVRGRSSKTVIKTTALYSYQQGRAVSVRGTGFMKRASLESANNLDKYFIEQVEKQMARV